MPIEYPYVSPNKVDNPEITRIDLTELPKGEGLRVVGFAAGWTASTPARVRQVRTDVTFDQAIAKMEEQGWKIRRWTNGVRQARAWKYKVEPVRTRAQIQALRDRITGSPELYPDLVIHTLDFAVDL